MRPGAIGGLVVGTAALTAAVAALPAENPLTEVLLGTPATGMGDLGVLVVGLVVCGAVFTLWPWALLPTAIVTVVSVAHLVGDGSVRAVMGVHALILVAGGGALLIRRLALPYPDCRCRTIADLPMIVLALLIAGSAGYGLLLGHRPYLVLLAGYQFAVIPAYYFLATCTLTTAARLRSAVVLFIVMSVVLILGSLTVPGRHGGAWALVIALPLLVASCRVTDWRRVGLVALTALYLVDVVLAGFRTTWLAAAVALLVLLLRGGPAIRRAAVVTITATATLLIGALVVSEGVRTRATVVSWVLQQDSGYRLPEAAVGLRVFLARPILGAGLGQSTPDVYLPGFRVDDVGPLYHVFHVMILANLGLIGLVALMWPLILALRIGLARRSGHPLAFAALICGFLVSIGFSGPTTGHWELGLLPALLLLTSRWSTTDARRPTDPGPLAATAIGPPRGEVPDRNHTGPVFVEAR